MVVVIAAAPAIPLREIAHALRRRYVKGAFVATSAVQQMLSPSEGAEATPALSATIALRLSDAEGLHPVFLAGPYAPDDWRELVGVTRSVVLFANPGSYSRLFERANGREKFRRLSIRFSPGTTLGSAAEGTLDGGLKLNGRLALADADARIDVSDLSGYGVVQTVSAILDALLPNESGGRP